MPTKTTIKLKRVYEKPAKDDGYRILVDRLWPRGVSKQRASLGVWLKDAAPSAELRTWFGHDPKKWAEFQKRYRRELAKNAAPVEELKKLVKKHRAVTLLFGARNLEHNEAVVLKKYISK